MHSLFSFSGRLNRLQFFFCQVGILLGILLMTLVVGGAATTTPFTEGNMLKSILALALVVPGLDIAVWMLAASTIKRLHDFGQSGYHFIWITALSLSSGLFDTNDVSPLAMSLNFASIAVSLFLLAMPGNVDENAYGPVPA